MKKLLLLVFFCISFVGRSQCPSPTQIVVTNITTTSFVVGWTSGGNEFLWEVIVLPAGTAPSVNDTGIMATVNPMVITGLTCGQYMVYVRAVCDGIPGPWSVEGTMVSMCQNELMPQEFCDTDNDGIEFVPLSEYNSTIQSMLPPGNYAFSYYLSESEAINQSAPLPEAAMVPTTMIFVRADDVDNPGTYYIYNYMVILNPLPEFNADNSLEVCDSDGDGFAVFDLEALAVQIYTNSGQTPNTWSVTFHETQTDAMNAMNPISNISAYTNISPGSQMIWVSITNNMTWCMTIAPITLEAISCDGILLNAFLDVNSNGIQDSGEIAFPYGTFTYAINNGPLMNLASSNGQFFIDDSNSANNYVINFNVNTNYATNFSVTPSNAAVTAGPGVQEVTFAVSATQAFADLSVAIVPFNQPQPGFNYSNKVIYTNFGTAQQSGTVTFTKDPMVNVLVMPAGAVANSTGFTYNFSNLLPFETREFTVVMNVPTIPTVSLGQLLTNSASITVPTGDILPANNTASLMQTIIGSYDPNDKVEAHGGPIVLEQFSPDEELIYTIRFENSGTASASFITVEDELDAQLDAMSLRMISASHDYVLTKDGQSLSWLFDDVNLPPTSQDPVGSHGYITFAVKPLTGLTVGDMIPNTASIFFDFNPAIVTNTFETQFMAPLSTPGFNATAFTLHPNPASAMVQLNSTKTINSISIADMTGKIVLRQDASAQNISFDISMLERGIYLIDITSPDGSRSIQKLIKN